MNKIDESTIEPLGDLRKDVMMFNECHDVDHNETIIRGIHYHLKVHQTEDGRAEAVENLSNLEEDELDRVKAELVINATLESNEMTFANINCLCKAISCCSFHITKMKLVGCDLSQRSLKQLAKSFKYFQAPLKHLVIEKNTILETSNARDEEIYNKLREINVQLVKLAKNNNFGEKPAGKRRHGKEDDGSSDGPWHAPKISKELLSACPFNYFLKRNIQSLSLRNCGITDSQITALSTVLGGHNNIKVLSLYGNSFGDEGLLSLAHALRTNISLISLNLGLNCNISNFGINRFAVHAFGWITLKSLSFEEIMNHRLAVYQSVYNHEKIPNTQALPVPEWISELALLGYELPGVNPSAFNPKKELKKKGKNAEKEKNSIEILPFDTLLSRKNFKNFGENGMAMITHPDPPVKEEKKKKKAAGGSSRRGGGGKKKKVKEEVVVEKVVKEVIPWEFRVKGNTTLKVILFHCNPALTDEGIRGQMIHRVGNTGLKRLGLGRTGVSEKMIAQVSKELGEVEPEKKVVEEEEKKEEVIVVEEKKE